MKMIAYRGPEDLHMAQAALMNWVRQRGHCSYWHKGDIGHRLFNGCYGYQHADVFRMWRDESGEVCAFVILYPHWGGMDLQVAPSMVCSAFHAQLIATCEDEMVKLSKRYSKPMKELLMDLFDCDPDYRAFVEACGYAHSRPSMTMTRHNLERIPEAPLPAGFRLHEAGAPDVERLADVHNHSFSSKWNADSYAEVFAAPHMEYEIVAVAPDGRFAAFTNVWIDDLNRSLLFEPVGTHADFRRQGLASALMTHVMRRMRTERGIECAYVCHEPVDKNPASGPLYRSLGFRKLHDISEYVKRVHITPQSATIGPVMTDC